MKFPALISAISDTHQHLQAEAAKSVNRLLTVRNWLIGFYIVEYEQKGEDRAEYGDQLLDTLEETLDIPGLSKTALKLNRQFYLLYFQIRLTVSAELQKISYSSDSEKLGIGQTVSDQFENAEKRKTISADTSKETIVQTVSAQLNNLLQNTKNESITIGQTVSDQFRSLPPSLQVPPEKLISRLSFSHFVELMKVDEPLKRTFYEMECIKGAWSVRELRRQIHSLYFERSGLSKKPEELSQKINQITKPENPQDILKNVYAFEFLDLRIKNTIEESELEEALLDNIQYFLLEMGHGFCLEARQKRILIGDNYFFIDLVFYHRVLKCHILIDLKVEEFKHANAGQLNTYLNYYKEEMMEIGDNPPIGILLVTHKNEALIKYATAGMDENLFVQKYLVELPSKTQLEEFVQKELRNW